MSFLKKYFCLVFTILCLLVLNILIISNTNRDKEFQNGMFRLHVVANSDSIKDQMLKLEVSKNVNDYLSSILPTASVTSKSDFKETVENNIDDILKVANNTICDSNSTIPGMEYLASANIGKIHYNEKEKNGIYMPEGTYDSLQIVLGDGKGENWWSLIFPYSYEGYYELGSNAKDANIYNNSADANTNYTNLSDNEISTKDLLGEDLEFDSILWSFIKKIRK